LEDELLRSFRLFVLKSCGWNRTWAAEVLGVSLRALRYQILLYKDQGFDCPDMPEQSRSELRNLHRMPRLSLEDSDIIREWLYYRRPDNAKLGRKSAGFIQSWRHKHA
jgi:hypothetical protein